MKLTTVPTNPNRPISPMFLKKNFFLMLNPADIMIGGSR